MERFTGGKLGSTAPDNLIAKLYPQPDSFLVELKTPGAYARGAVLSLESDGTYELLGAGSGAASCVLAEPTLADDTTVVAYRSGHFNRNALIAAEGYALTAADENSLRLGGIFLSDMLQAAGEAGGGDDPEPGPEQPDATLSALAIGSLTLTPDFDKDVTEYAAATTNATNTVTATATDEGATVAILNGETSVASGSAATWEEGENTLTITVTNGEAEKVYTVTVTKS